MKRVVALVALTLVLVGSVPVPAFADSGGRNSDVFGQLFGGNKYPSNAGTSPIGNYQLDWDIDTDTDIGPIAAPKPAGMMADVANSVANTLWTICLLVAKLVGGMFAWAFSVDFLTGPHGVLRPIGDATRVMYDNLFGREVLYAAIALAGGWAALQAMRGRSQQGVAMLGAAFVYCTLAVAVATNLPALAGPVVAATQEVSSSVLSMRASGTISADRAEREANEHIMNTFVVAPFMLLEFGGTQHCVDPTRLDDDGYPVPKLPDDRGAKTCRDHLRYTRMLTAYAPGSDDRHDVVSDLIKGEGDFDKTDAPAGDMMLQGNAYIRLVLAAGVLLGMIFVGLFLAVVSLFIALASITLVVGLAFSAAMAPLAFVPHVGEAVVRFWAGLLLGCLVTKVAYSLLLGVLITANTAIMAAAGATLPPGYAFLVNTAMFGGAILYRKRIHRGVAGARARLESRGDGAVRQYASSAVVSPVKTVTGRVAYAAAGGGATGRAAQQVAHRKADTSPAPSSTARREPPPRDHDVEMNDGWSTPVETEAPPPRNPVT